MEGKQVYGPIIGSGAEKLEASGVAPLVALAHGYRSIQADDVDGVIDHLRLAKNSTQARQIRGAVGDLDALLMPWFKPEDVVNQQGKDYAVAPSSLQMRPHPSNARTDANGRKRKYENLVGQALVMGIHPATPAQWLTEPIERLMIVEGALKADSVISAYLRDNGATEKELSVTKDMDYLDAIDKLRPLFERIPESKRVIIMGIVGVSTWHKQPEWNTLKLTGDAYVSFDGDVAQNPAVWREAHRMFTFFKQKKVTPYLVDLGQEPLIDGAKVGADDYLAQGHSWSDLVDHITDTLPKNPDADGDAKYRMNPLNDCMEERMVIKEDGFESSEWKVKAQLTARVEKIVESREVSLEEEETGRLSVVESPRQVNSDCVIEVAWREDGQHHTSKVEGPATLMATKPERWTDPRLGAGIHADVLSLPAWPPTANGFLEAMKRYRREDIERVAAWTHMGWVPTETSPVFCVGEQVIGASGFTDTAVCGVGENELAGATRFGVDLPDSDEEAREAIRTMVEVYEACWSDPRNFAVVLAAALRPVVPIHSSIPLYYSGTSGAGKSLTAAAIMAFWQPRPNAWSNKHLPGSAADTASASEIAISKTPVWVMDDNAPSSANPRAQADRTEVTLSAIRAVHNGAAKRRATKDMGSQKTNRPRALLIVSSESAPLDDTSIMNRVAHIEVQPGFLVPSHEPTDRLEKLTRETTVAARVTGAALTMMARDIERQGWESVRSMWMAEMEELNVNTLGVVREAIPGAVDSAKRQAETITDLMMGLQVFTKLCSDLGLHELKPRTMEMFDDLQSLAIEGFSENQRSDLGPRFLSDLRMLLASGQAHVAGLGVPGAPCVVGDAGVPDTRTESLYNQSLGWRLTGDADRPHEPRGEAIGNLVHTADGRPVVLFSDAAFNLVQKKGSHRGGINAKAAWDAVWKSKLAVPESEGWKRKPRSGDRLDYRVRVSSNGIQTSGVPVYLSVLLDD